jgi:hypothetical protein
VQAKPIFSPRPRRSIAAADGPSEPIAAAAADDDLDRALIEIVRRPLMVGETRAAGFQRKEHQLARLFATLSPADNLRLHRRLDAGRGDDPIVVAFSSLVADRRYRLLTHLADLRRRSAR